MATVTVNVTRTDHVADFQTIFNETAKPYLVAATNVVKAAVQRRAPVHMGFFRNSITIRVDETGNQLTGSIYSTDPGVKVAVIEEGRRAGAKFPPQDVIMRWVQLVIGPAPAMLKSVTYLVRRKIARAGIKGRHPFQLGEQDSHAEAFQILSVDLQAELVKKL
jgi:hypothetical protein